MAVIRTNAQNQIVMWGEATFGTRPSPVSKGQRIPIIGHDLGRTQSVGKSRVLNGDPSPTQPPRGRMHVEGHKISVPIEKSMIGLFLYKFFNSYAVTGAGDPYAHVFKVLSGAWHAAGPGVGFEIWDTEAVKGDVLDGCNIIGIECEVNTDDTEAMITFEVLGLGKGDWDDVARQQATPATFTDPFFNMSDARIKVDTAVTTRVVNGKFALKRKASVRYVPDGNDYASVIILGGIDTASVSLTGLFDDASTVRALATGETEHNVEFLFAHPSEATHNLSFLFPEVMAYLSNVPAVGDGNEREVTVEGTAYYQNGADATCCKATLNNAIATYVGVMQ
jgi:Phage tail tube protein